MSASSLTLTDHEDLSRLISRGLGLGGLHLLEELLEDPEQRLVVLGAEDLGDEGAALVQELTGQLQGHEGQVSWKHRRGLKFGIEESTRLGIIYNFLL